MENENHMKWSSDNFYLYFQINHNKCVLPLTNYTAVQFRLVEKLLFAKRVKDDDWGPKTHDIFVNSELTSNTSFFWTLVVLGAAFHVTLFLALYPWKNLKAFKRSGSSTP